MPYGSVLNRLVGEFVKIRSTVINRVEYSGFLQEHDGNYFITDRLTGAGVLVCNMHNIIEHGGTEIDISKFQI